MFDLIRLRVPDAKIDLCIFFLSLASHVVAAGVVNTIGDHHS